jgi:hypothetical protein
MSKISYIWDEKEQKLVKRDQKSMNFLEIEPLSPLSPVDLLFQSCLEEIKTEILSRYLKKDEK